LERLVRHPAIVDATIDTGTLDRNLEAFVGEDEGAPADAATHALLAAATADLLAEEAEGARTAARSADPHSPWALADGWRLGHAGLRRIVLGAGDARHVVEAHGSGGDYRIVHGGRQFHVAGARVANASMAETCLSARCDGQARRYRIDVDAGHVRLHDGRRRWRFARVPAYEVGDSIAAGGGDRIVAPMPGRVVLAKVAAGDEVTQGQELLVMEAMKMELALKAPRDGTVAELRAQAGDFVEADAVLVVLEP
ncbi:MAG: biotin/lipoyl-containing protein, partial [Luteimonas sp.]